MKYSYVALGLLLFTGGCKDNPPPPAPQTVTAEPGPAETPEDLAPRPKMDLPRYVGRWSESKDQCPQKWVRLWVDELLTSEQLRCQILPQTAEGGDSKLRMICIDLGKRSRENWRLDYPDANSLKIRREKERARTLMRC